MLSLLRERLTNEQIAERLGISLDGAKYHVSEILSKLGASTREEAARWRPSEMRPWWMRLVTLPAAAKIAGGLTLVAAAGGLAILAWGVAETGGPPEPVTSALTQPTAAPVQPAPNLSPADCKDSTPVLLDGQPACSFSLEVVKDFPARLEGGSFFTEPRLNATMGSEILLYATCAPEGSCVGLATDEPVIEERTSRIDWRIDARATIVVVAPRSVETDSIPVRNYRLVQLRYEPLPPPEACQTEFSGFCSNHTLFNTYEQVPDPSSAQGLASFSSNCKHGTRGQLDGETACQFTFDADDIPAQLNAYTLQYQVASIRLHAACTTEAACVRFETGEPVTEETGLYISWRIDRPATIVLTSPDVVEIDGNPVRQYRLVDFAYDHPADRICTGDRLYCYIFTANYEPVN